MVTLYHKVYDCTTTRFVQILFGIKAEIAQKCGKYGTYPQKRILTLQSKVLWNKNGHHVANTSLLFADQTPNLRICFGLSSAQGAEHLAKVITAELDALSPEI